MSGLKTFEPALRFSNSGTAQNKIPTAAITPDEIDRYEVVTIVNPNTLTANQFIGTWAVAGTGAAGALVIINAIPDWPRNLEWSLTGTAAGMTGTASVVGFDQFGSPITESFTFAGANNGGTTAGTKVFAQVTSGTMTFGTAVGNGTARLGLGTTGTTALFGLPFKVGGTTDLKMLSVNAGTGGVTVNGGTIAAFVSVPMHALKLPVAQTTGTMAITAWFRPTFNSENLGLVANLSQRT